MPVSVHSAGRGTGLPQTIGVAEMLHMQSLKGWQTGDCFFVASSPGRVLQGLEGRPLHPSGDLSCYNFLEVSLSPNTVGSLAVGPMCCGVPSVGTEAQQCLTAEHPSHSGRSQNCHPLCSSRGALCQGVSCSNLAVSTHYLPEPSEANIHNAQLFWWLLERKGTSEN